MDIKRDWAEYFMLPNSFRSKSVNIVGHSDGGTRAESCSAAGWVVEAIMEQDGETQIATVALCGTYFKEPISSLLAEAIALEDMIT